MVNFEIRKLNLAGVDQRIVNGVSNYLMIKSVTPDTGIKVAIGDDDLTDIEPGMAVDLRKDGGFNEVTFRNDSGVAAEIKFVFSKGVVYLAQLVIADEIPVDDSYNSIEPFTEITVATATPATSKIEAVANQKAVELKNTGTVDVYYSGTDAVDAALKKGGVLTPGEGRIVPMSTDIYLHSASAGQTVSGNIFKKV